MKHKKIAKQRNQLVALALFRKAGSHRKSNKAQRRQEKSRMCSSEEEHLAFNQRVEISKFSGHTRFDGG
jgi:hypothetical protein